MNKAYNITPVAKPRMTQSDKWQKRKCVLKYRAYCDEVRSSGIEIPEYGALIEFVIPMPPTWPWKKKKEMNGRPHQQRGDIDNFLKAILDALFDDDSKIWDIHARKTWGLSGMIVVTVDSPCADGVR